MFHTSILFYSYSPSFVLCHAKNSTHVFLGKLHYFSRFLAYVPSSFCALFLNLKLFMLILYLKFPMTLWQNVCNYAQTSPARLLTFVFTSSPIVCVLEILEYLFLLFPLPRIPSLLWLLRNSCFPQDLHWTHFPTKFSMEKSEWSEFLPLPCVCLSHVWLFTAPWTIACQAPLSMELSRQEYWSGLPFPSQGDLPNSGIEPGLPHCRQILYHLSHQEGPTSSSEAILSGATKEGDCKEGTNKTQAINTKDTTGFSWS